MCRRHEEKPLSPSLVSSGGDRFLSCYDSRADLEQYVLNLLLFSTGLLQLGYVYRIRIWQGKKNWSRQQ